MNQFTELRSELDEINQMRSSFPRSDWLVKLKDLESNVIWFTNLTIPEDEREEVLNLWKEWGLDY